MDNILIQYKGGGYDGCFWEWNYAAIVNGEFVDIFSSGRSGCETKEELDEMMADARNTEWSKDYYTYDLHSEEEMDDFMRTSNGPHVHGVAKKLYEYGIEFDAECSRCGTRFTAAADTDWQFCNYKSFGGTAFGATDFLCIECYMSPSDEEWAEAVNDYAGNLEDMLPKKYPELDDIDPPFEAYENLAKVLLVETDMAGNHEWIREDDWMWFDADIDDLMKHFSDRLSEFVALFMGQWKLPEDMKMREAGHAELPRLGGGV